MYSNSSCNNSGLGLLCMSNMSSDTGKGILISCQRKPYAPSCTALRENAEAAVIHTGCTINLVMLCIENQQQVLCSCLTLCQCVAADMPEFADRCC